jgi:hypothetical protein
MHIHVSFEDNLELRSLTKHIAEALALFASQPRDDADDDYEPVVAAPVPFDGPWNKIETVELCGMVSPYRTPDDDLPHACDLARGHDSMHHTSAGAGYEWPGDACQSVNPATGVQCGRGIDHPGQHSQYGSYPDGGFPSSGARWDDVVYAWPAPPPTGTTLADPLGFHWRSAGEAWKATPGPNGMIRTDRDGLPETWTWPELLQQSGVLRVVPRTPEQRAEDRLYGPVGARWGNPDQPCPYTTCDLGVGHIGPHVDDHGVDIPVPTGDVSLSTVAEAMKVICTCGHPSAHTRDCPRHVSSTTAAPLAKDEPVTHRHGMHLWHTHTGADYQNHQRPIFDEELRSERQHDLAAVEDDDQH